VCPKTEIGFSVTEKEQTDIFVAESAEREDRNHFFSHFPPTCPHADRPSVAHYLFFLPLPDQ
jgi:hypothetical protein